MPSDTWVFLFVQFNQPAAVAFNHLYWRRSFHSLWLHLENKLVCTRRPGLPTTVPQCWFRPITVCLHQGPRIHVNSLYESKNNEQWCKLIQLEAEQSSTLSECQFFWRSIWLKPVRTHFSFMRLFVLSIVKGQRRGTLQRMTEQSSLQNHLI